MNIKKISFAWIIVILFSFFVASCSSSEDKPAETTPSSSSPTTPSSSDTTAPTFSGLSTATASSSTQIDLSWTAATDNVSASGAIVYEICQSSGSGTCASTWTATYTTAAGATSYSVTGLTASTTYYFVVRAKDEAGNSDTNTTEKSAKTYFSHTITIDGTNDFTANETFTTTSTGYTAYITWDDTYVYYGVDGADVNSGVATKWVLAYIGGSGGTTTGVTYNSQTPTLPFNAKWHIRWKADNTYTNTQTYTSSWGDAAWDFTGDVFKSGTFIELRVPRADIGSPTTLQIHINMINELSLSEWTYSGAPSTSFTDGVNPNYAKFLSCDLTNGAAPDTACSVM